MHNKQFKYRPIEQKAPKYIGSINHFKKSTSYPINFVTQFQLLSICLAQSKHLRPCSHNAPLFLYWSIALCKKFLTIVYMTIFDNGSITIKRKTRFQSMEKINKLKC